MVTLIPNQVSACLRAQDVARDPSQAKKVAVAAAKARTRAKTRARATNTNPTDLLPRGQACLYRLRALRYPSALSSKVPHPKCVHCESVYGRQFPRNSHVASFFVIN